MSTARLRPLALTLALALATPAAMAASYVYEGRLDDLGQPANGRYDLRLSAYGHESHGATLAAPVTFEGVEVRDGRFRLDVDLPLVKSDSVWLELAVRDSGAAGFSAIPGRSKAIAAPLIGACWSTTGDASSNPASNFLGTTDNQALVLRVNNQQALRVEPTAGSPNLIGGSSANFVSLGVQGANIGGGASGLANRVTDEFGTVSGGQNNLAGNNSGPVNDANFATVAGGASNSALGRSSAIGGGFNNTASGALSSVAGGGSNTARGDFSVVAGGTANCAGGDNSWAGGVKAKVRPGPGSAAVGAGCTGVSLAPVTNGDLGTFAWADSQDADFVSTGPNQFLIRADGGLFYNTNTTVASFDDVVLRARQNSGDSDMDLRLVSRNAKSARITVSDGTGGVVIAPNNLTPDANRLVVGGGSGGGATLTFGGAWTNASSRTFKEGFAAVNPLDVLKRLIDLPIGTWSYTGSEEGLHLGPVAEDFKAAFGLAGDGKSIATVDADGVALAAIQGLNQKLEAENAELRARLERLEQRVLGP